MYKKVNITENHLRILSLFTRGFDKEYYIREVERLLKISPRTAQLILEDLEKKTILESKLRGKIKTYSLKKTEAARNYLILAEQYKKIVFLEDRSIIKEIIAKITPHVQGLAFIFGSYVKNLATKDSDLDIFVAGECDLKEIRGVSKTYGLEINVKQYPQKVFIENFRKDILIKEVLDNHIIFLNSEELIKLVFENG